jgi:hypothetical protein
MSKFEEALADLVNEALAEGESRDSVMSALELLLMGMEEDEANERNSEPGPKADGG